MTLIRRVSLAVVLVIVLLCPRTARSQQSLTTAYQGVAIVDVDNGTVTANRTLIVSGARILSIHDAAEPLPPGIRVVSLAGRFVVPGLIDAHVHFFDSVGPRNALSSGVTTARSMGTSKFFDVDLRDSARTNPAAYPELQAAGYHIRSQVPKGLVALYPELEDMLLDSVSSEEDLRRIAQAQVKSGIDVLKIGGDFFLAPAPRSSIWRRRWLRVLRWLKLAPDPSERPLSAYPPGPEYQSMFSESAFTVLAADMKAAGVAVAVHAANDASARSAARAGVASIEHGTYLTDTTLAIMADRGVYLVPSLSRAEWREHDHLDRVRAMVREAHRLGVPLAAGSDSRYVDGTPLIASEIEAFEQAGLPRSAALRAGTIGGARLLGIDDRTGLLKAGYEADFLVVEENPLDDLETLQNPILVFSDGILIKDQR